jgi:hypothetical protein
LAVLVVLGRRRRKRRKEEDIPRRETSCNCRWQQRVDAKWKSYTYVFAYLHLHAHVCLLMILTEGGREKRERDAEGERYRQLLEGCPVLRCGACFCIFARFEVGIRASLGSSSSRSESS